MEPKKHRFLQHAPKSLFPLKDAATYSQILSALLQAFIPISPNHFTLHVLSGRYPNQQSKHFPLTLLGDV